jgi:tetratricopeptide (TPR) repeat protein
MKLISQRSDDNEVTNSKEKIQNTKINIQLHPLYSITIIPVNDNFRIYKTTSKIQYKVDEITLVKINDSIDVSKVNEVIKQLSLAIINKPNDPSNYLDRAILFSSIKKYNESFADYEKSIQLNPTNPMTWFSRANTRFKLLELIHSFDEDRVLLNNQIKKTKNSVQNDHTYEMVLEDYKKAISLDKTFTYAWYNSASVKIKLNDYKGATDDLTKAIELDPLLSDAYYNRALLLIVMNYPDIACKDLSKAGELGVQEAYNVIKKYCK